MKAPNGTWCVRLVSASLIGLGLLAVAARLSAEGTPTLSGVTPLAIAPGAPAGSFPLSGFENVNLYSGNLNFALPLLHIQGRGDAQMTMTLLNEQHWEIRLGLIDQGGQPVYAAHLEPMGNAKTGGYGAGWMTRRTGQVGVTYLEGYGYVTSHTSLTRFTFSAPDGTETEFRDALYDGQPHKWQGGPGLNRGRKFLSRDGSAAIFTTPVDVVDPANEVIHDGATPATGTLQFANGTTYEIVKGSVRWISDRNGNMLHLEYYDEPDGRLFRVTDSLDRKVTVSYSYSPGPLTVGEDRITYKGFRGVDRTIVVRSALLEDRLSDGYEIQTLQHLVPSILFDPTQTNNIRVIAEVELPNGTLYEFRYNAFGELTKVTLPTGGSIEYEWRNALPNSAHAWSLGEASPPSSYAIYHRVWSRRVTNYNVIEQHQEFENRPDLCSPDSGELCAIDVKEYHPATSQLLGLQRHWFTGNPFHSFSRNAVQYNGWNEGRETRVDIFEGSASEPLRSQSSAWEQRAPVDWCNPAHPCPDQEPANDVRLASTSTNVGGLTTRVANDYDEFNNVIRKREFDYGVPFEGAPLRTTETIYMREAYVAARLLRLPKEIKVSDSHGERSKVTFAYDESPLVERPNIVGWTPPPSVRGNVTRIEQHQNWQGEPDSVTKRAYDVAGNVVRIVDPREHPTRIFYDDDYGLPNGRLQEGGRNTFAFPTRVVNALQHETRTQYDYHTGKVVDQREPNGTVTSLDFDDPLDRLMLVVKAANQGGQSYRSKLGFVYNDGRVLRLVTSYGDHNKLGDAYSQHRIRYDELGRETHVSARDPRALKGDGSPSRRRMTPGDVSPRSPIPATTATRTIRPGRKLPSTSSTGRCS